MADVAPIQSAPALPVVYVDMPTQTAKVAASVVMLLLSVGCSDSPTPTAPSPPGSVSISSVTPSQGSSVESTTVTIKGKGFSAGATVSIGALTLPATVVSEESLIVLVPAQPPGVHDVIVTNRDRASATLRFGFQFMVGLSEVHVAVTVAGQILAGDSDTPVARASVRLVGSKTVDLVPPQSDDDGRFVLQGTVSHDADTLGLQISAENIGSWFASIPRTTAASAVVRLSNLLMIRAGGRLTSELGRGHGACTFEDVPCRRLYVDAPPGSRVDLELIAEEGQLVGLIVEETFLAPRDYPKRVTVSPSQVVWIMGNFGTFTLRAHHPTAATERTWR